MEPDQLIETESSPSEISQQALRRVQEAEKVRTQADEVQLQSMSEVAEFLRQERSVLQELVKIVTDQVESLVQISQETVAVRDSLIQEYQIQQQITQAMQHHQTEQQQQVVQQHQEPQQVPKNSFTRFLSNS